MLQGVLRLGLLLAFAGCALVFGLKRSDEPTVDCASLPGAGRDYHLLVVGESWATGGKFFPELLQAISERLHGRGVEACAIAFAGRSSKLLYFELREKFPTDRLYGYYDEKKPDKVILMTGVNDEIQHVGAASYVEYTKKLVEYFSDVDDVELISLPRVAERQFKAPNLYSAIKRTLLRCLYDGCDLQVNDLYRSALWRDHPELHVIEYDDFISSYDGHEECYTFDGIHLTEECLHKYGAFLGKAASLAKGGAAGRDSALSRF